MENKIPSYYIVSRKMGKDQIGPILNALNITPVYTAIISDIHDAELGLCFSAQVMRCQTEDSSCEVARAMSQEQRMPILVVGTADILDAVFIDGHKEQVCCVN